MIVLISERYEYPSADAFSMHSSGNALSGPLRWERQSTLSRNYVLRGPQGDAGSLSWPKLTSSNAEGAIGNKSYSFSRKGMFRPVVTMLQAPFDADVATMRLSSGGGSVEFTNGKRYELVKLGAFKQVWTFKDDQGREVMTLQVPAFKTRVGELAVRGDLRDPHIPQLLLLIWYAVVPQLDQSGGA